MIFKSSGQFYNNNPQQKHHESNINIATSSRKRTHLTTAQISGLQTSFETNPLPDAAIRQGLSLSLGIAERTVQIWFQNRRAKARKMEGQSGSSSSSGGGGKSNTTLGDTYNSLPTSNSAPRYQTTFRSMMTPQMFQEMNATSQTSSSSQQRSRSASKPEKPKPIEMTLAPRAKSEENNHLQQLQCSSRTSTMNQSNAVPLPIHMLRIGTWARLANLITTMDGSTIWDLLCYYTTNQLVWQIQVEGQQFLIHIPPSAIHQLYFGPAEEVATTSLATTSLSKLKIHLDPQQLTFTMCLDNHQWVRCGDFSEQQQASQLFIHELQGYHNLLQQSIVDMLTTLPELATKLVLVSPPLLDDLCPKLTLSPSATPEPFYSFMVHGSSTSNCDLAALDKPMTPQVPLYMDPLSTPYQDQDSAGHWY